ncbi:DUF3883 domain-containing protein [Flavobacterium wongokense]|uniref:DUF3883 domain-containing protein n=1 Tax=Flavobacterium wongokense TaxID=2910674 RepID=UPI001F1ED1C0|nr:DUF3883 domain-containing protein [Flavobacterium sp. WG47]MCF6130889.1 DUF3883 domain-containing protein [Flavobacterium sp. WG47]
MNLHDLREAQAAFVIRLDEIFENRKGFHNKRIAFTRYFTSRKIAEMDIDEFVIGKGEHTFCRKIERDLNELGMIIGSTAFKFGVYFGRTKTDPEHIYRNTKIWGQNEDESFANIAPAIVKLIKDGADENIKEIINSKLSPMFKGKILSTYYPERYLNVFSDDHLKYFLKSFDLDTAQTLKANPVVKRELLLEMKNNDPVMKNWSIDLFMVFLYDFYPKRPIKNPKPIPDILEDYYEPNFPTNPIASEVELNILPFEIVDSGSRNPRGNTKPDYEKLARLNKKLGDRGEKVVMDFEKRRLAKREFCNKIKRVSLESDTYGYDILSFEDNDEEIKRYIEVKATRAKVGNANFFLTINELKTAKEKENYFIYLVYDILSKEPKIWIIGNPFNPENNKVNLQPINYKVSIKVQ